jgi:hypothetical protein
MKKPSYIKKKKPLYQPDKTKKLNEAIIEIYRKGGRIEEIEKYLQSIGRLKNIRHDIWNANAQIKEEAKLERDSLIQVHVKRYEKIFRDNFNKTEDDFAQMPVHIRRYMLIDSLMIAMDALIAKEKVLGLHTKQFRVQLNNFFKKKIIAQYNFNNQNFEDLVRLKQLLEKMKTDDVPQQQYFDDLEEETKEAKTIDVNHIEINAKNANKIKETTTINTNGRGTSREIVEDITEKIIQNDIKNNDPKRNLFLEKLKKLNGKH